MQQLFPDGPLGQWDGGAVTRLPDRHGCAASANPRKGQPPHGVCNTNLSARRLCRRRWQHWSADDLRSQFRSGLTQLSFENLAKSVSAETSSDPWSIAMAVRCASVVRFPAASASSMRPLSTRQWWMMTIHHVVMR
jgi:hypothetical protein